MTEFIPKASVAARLGLTLRVVPDEYGACPRCGAYWGHPDKALDFPNRQKVDNAWRCYNPNCTCGYYDPDSGQVLEDKLSPEAEAKARADAATYVADMLKGRVWITRGDRDYSESTTIAEGDPVPEGWRLM